MLRFYFYKYSYMQHTLFNTSTGKIGITPRFKHQADKSEKVEKTYGETL